MLDCLSALLLSLNFLSSTFFFFYFVVVQPRECQAYFVCVVVSYKYNNDKGVRLLIACGEKQTLSLITRGRAMYDELIVTFLWWN